MPIVSNNLFSNSFTDWSIKNHVCSHFKIEDLTSEQLADAMAEIKSSFVDLQLFVDSRVEKLDTIVIFIDEVFLQFAQYNRQIKDLVSSDDSSDASSLHEEEMASEDSDDKDVLGIPFKEEKLKIPQPEDNIWNKMVSKTKRKASKPDIRKSTNPNRPKFKNGLRILKNLL